MLKRTLPTLCGAIMLVSAAAVAAQDGATKDTVTSDRQQIARLEDAWRKARIDADIPFLERFYAAELRIQAMDGKVQSRAADIAMFSSGRIKPKFIEHGPLDITLYGATAVVTGLDHLGGSYMGHYGELYLRFTDVLVKRDGRWQLVIQQATQAQAEPPAP